MFETLPDFGIFHRRHAKRNHLFRIFRNVARAFDFREYDAPVLEPLDLYIEKSGPEIASQLFHFEDKGERKVALRPELTPTWQEWLRRGQTLFQSPSNGTTSVNIFVMKGPKKDGDDPSINSMPIFGRKFRRCGC